MTLVLTRSQIAGLLVADIVLTALHTGFRTADPQARFRHLRVRTKLPGPGTATILMPGLIVGIPAYTVKVNAKFPAAVPPTRGVVCLHDLTDGRLLAMLDSATVTAWRTGLAAALATHVLATGDAGSVAVIGAGVQARMVLRGLSRLRRLTRLTVCDPDVARATAFADEHAEALGIPAETVRDPREAARRATIVVLATWSRRPLLDASDLRAGMHLTTLGANEPGKIELAADALRRARTIVDDILLAVRGGPIGNAGLDSDVVDATFGQVLSGERPGRESIDQITVYAAVGMPWQDLALAWPVYQAATDAGTGMTVDFLT